MHNGIFDRVQPAAQTSIEAVLALERDDLAAQGRPVATEASSNFRDGCRVETPSQQRGNPPQARGLPAPAKDEKGTDLFTRRT